MLKKQEYFLTKIFTIYKRCDIIGTSKHYNVASRGDSVIKKEMIAMLLAGGQGSRLGVLTAKVAKPAVAFGSLTFHSVTASIQVLTP